MKPCEHKVGCWIKDMMFWLCADCFERLPERPKKYGPGLGPGPQVIIWQAEVATDKVSGVTLDGFLRTMALRFHNRTRPKMPISDAYDLAIESLKLMGDKFGDPAYDWSHAGAREMADLEMEHFDHVKGN